MSHINHELVTIAGEAESPASPILDPAAPMQTALAFMAREHRKGASRLLHEGGTFYAWMGTHYVEQSVETIRARLWNFLNESQAWHDKALVPFNPNTHKVANVLEALRAVAQILPTVPGPAWLDDPKPYAPGELIACRNGLLHLPTGTLLPHTPEFFTLNALGFDYDPSASMPTQWLSFLGQIWPNDPQARDTLQEIFGLLLTNET